VHARSISDDRPGASRQGDQHGQPWTTFLNPEERTVGGSIPP